MRVYLLRHGIAEDGRPGMPDSERTLTGEGRRKLRDVIKAAKGAGFAPDLIVSSPYRRCIETADVAAQMVTYKDQLVLSDALVPDGNTDEVWTELRAYRDMQAVLLVSHEPLIGYLFGYLLGTPSLLVDFKKGALARIDIDAFGPRPRGVFRYFLPPKLAGE